MTFKIQFLGTAATEPVPAPGCHCPNCDNARIDPGAQRLQSGLLVNFHESNYLIDCSATICARNLWNNALPLSAVFISHSHSDHYFGLHFLRWSCQSNFITTYVPKDSNTLSKLFDKPLKLKFEFLDFFKTIKLNDLTVTSVKLNHGSEPTQGFIFQHGKDSFAYLTDTRDLPYETWIYLERMHLNCAIIDACYPPGIENSSHNNLDQAIEMGRKIGSDLVVFTHFAHHNLPKIELENYVSRQTGANTKQVFMCAYDGFFLHI